MADAQRLKAQAVSEMRATEKSAALEQLRAAEEEKVRASVLIVYSVFRL